MAINVKKIGAISRSDLIWFDPDELVIVTDKDHPLFDERAAFAVSRELINNIKVYGVLEPVLGRFNPTLGKTEIIDGRQRTAAARVAKAEQVAAGEVVVRVPVVMRREDDEVVMGIMISANEQRRGDTTKVKGKKAARMKSMGMTKKEIATAFGVSTQTITIWLDALAGKKRKPARAPGAPTKREIRAKLAEMGEVETGNYDDGFAAALTWVLGESE